MPCQYSVGSNTRKRPELRSKCKSCRLLNPRMVHICPRSSSFSKFISASSARTSESTVRRRSSISSRTPINSTERVNRSLSSISTTDRAIRYALSRTIVGWEGQRECACDNLSFRHNQSCNAAILVICSKPLRTREFANKILHQNKKKRRSEMLFEK